MIIQILIMNYFQNLSPINQLVILVAFIGLLFGFLVVYLDNSKDYALKRDWRDKDGKQYPHKVNKNQQLEEMAGAGGESLIQINFLIFSLFSSLQPVHHFLELYLSNLDSLHLLRQDQTSQQNLSLQQSSLSMFLCHFERYSK